jgi:hypothetical protein
MTDMQNVGLTKDQLDLVLRGLRFVRSSISMELLEHTDEKTSTRSDRLSEVDGLVKQLTGKGERVSVSV